MKKLFWLGILLVMLCSCNPDRVYTQEREYCCGEVCCEGYEHYENYHVGNNTLEVVEKNVNGHTHKVITTQFHG